MFTVVIAGQEHINGIKEYRRFLCPFLNKTQVTFCQWEQGGSTLNEMVPQLVKTVGAHEQWRAVIVCDERCLSQENPFNVVPCIVPQPPKEEQTNLYFEQLWKAKREAFDKAAGQPLTKLVTFLCESNIISTGQNRKPGDLEFFQYRKEALYKQALREKILNGYKPKISMPSEVLCIAKRTVKTREDAIRSSWTPHTDFQYTRFYDWNLYFDKMRYLIFDIIPKENQNYASDYIRFLYVLLLIANNEIPKGSLRPCRVYGLDCENNEGVLKELFGKYESKLLATDEELSNKLHELENVKRPHLSDKEAESIFCKGVTIPVNVAGGFDESELYVSGVGKPIAAEAPSSDSAAWQFGYDKSMKAMYRFLKLPRRALRRACDNLRNMNRADTERVLELNAFQIEDVVDQVAEEENDMVATPTKDVLNIELYKDKLDNASREVKKKLKTRVSRGAAFAFGGLALILFLIGFLPLIYKNLGDTKIIDNSLIFIACNLGLLGMAEYICLFILRWLLRRKIRDYNDIMKDLVKDVEVFSLRFSKYLSHACNVMRGFSVLNRYEGLEAPEYIKARVLKKHRMDIRRCREELHEVFGRYLTEKPLQKESPYIYDFQRPVDFAYPIPYDEDVKIEIEFIQPGNTVIAPVRFVRRITVKMEELYD